jgi:hypothetical protein
MKCFITAHFSSLMPQTFVVSYWDRVDQSEVAADRGNKPIPLAEFGWAQGR